MTIPSLVRRSGLESLEQEIGSYPVHGCLLDRVSFLFNYYHRPLLSRFRVYLFQIFYSWSTVS